MKPKIDYDGTELVQILIPINQATNPIGLNTKLEKKFITAIEFNGSMKKTPLGKATFGTNSADAKEVTYLTLKDVYGKEFVNLFPVNNLDPLRGDNAGGLIFNEPVEIDIQNSYVTVGDGSLLPANGETICFTFYYKNSKTAKAK